MAQTRTDMAAPAEPTGTPTGERETAPRLKLSNYLGALEADPDDREALAELEAIASAGDRERLGEEPARLLEMARQGHELRGELPTVARLIEVEILLVQDDKPFCASLWKELGRLRAELLLDPEAARAAYTKALELKGDDSEITEALRRLEQSEASGKKFAKRFVEEAESATDLSLKTSLLLRAACLSWEYKRKGKSKEADKLFKKVLELDPANMRAAVLYEQTLREREEWKALAQHLLDTAEAARDKQDRVNFYVRGARAFARKLGEKSRAAACYERALDFDPTNPEALSFLSQHFTEGEQWDHLVGLYEDALRVPQKVEVEQGILLQIGMVHWRMRQKPSEAEPYFARLRKLDPAHPAMLDFYRAHLAQAGDAEGVLRVLLDAQRVSVEPGCKVELACEAARLAQTLPGTQERAIEGWKTVQRLDPSNSEATTVLKELYAKSEKWNALVDVLKAQVDAVPDSEPVRKVEVLRELAQVYRDHLRLDGMLINAYNAILRIAPSDRATLSALAAKYRELGRWNDLINVLSADAELLAEPAARIATYLEVAQLWVEHFSNYNQAASPLERVLEIEPANREALSRLRDIYEKKRAWKQLFEVLKKERSVASDPAVRAKLTVMMAELAADRLQRYQDAVELWREVSSDPHYGASALEALEKLAEREKDWPTLAQVLEQQVARESSDEARIRVLLKLGSLHAERSADPEAASRAWRRILEIDPKQGRALRSLRDSLLSFGEWDALEALYERAGDFEGLVDVLSGEADAAQSREAKVDLSLRAARVFEEKIREPARAQRSYERVLSVDPQNVRAARALAPIYEKDEKWSRLCGVLEVIRQGLPAASATTEKLELLARLRVLAQDKLRDGEGAFGHALAAYQLAPTDPSVRESLEAAAELAQAFDRVVEQYQSRGQAASADEALLLHRRIATFASERLGRAELAASEWQKVLDAVPTDAAALAALDRIYRAEQRTPDIRKLLLHKLGLTQQPQPRAELLKELAVLEESKLADPEAAASRYRELAKLEPESREVWSALDRLAQAAGRNAELAEILQTRRSVEEERAMRIELGSRLAALLLDELAQPQRAVEVLTEVIELDPEHGPSLAALEKLAEDPADGTPELRQGILVTLEKAYERAGRFDRLAKVVTQRLQSVRDEVELRRLRLRMAEISGGKLGDALGAYSALEQAFLEQPDDRSLWQRLAEAAETAQQHRALANAYARAIESESLPDADRVELATRAARIYDEVVGEPQEAEPFHKRVLAHEPLADTAFTALKEIYTTQERWEDLQALYRKRIDETVDTGQRLDLLLQVCFLFEEILDRPDMAIEAYQAVLELAPDHGPSRRTLEKLYERTERYRDLANLLRANLDQAEGYDQVDLMYRLGELYETKLSEPGPAVDQYEGVLQNQPHHLRAQAALARLLAVESQRQRVAAILEPVYESQGAYADLARVLEIQLADRTTRDAQAALLLRVGELHEHRLRDPEGAFSAFARAVECDPSDKLAREALGRVAATREAYRRKRAQVLERAVDTVQDHDVQIELLLELGQLFDQYLDDRVAAERIYDRLLALAVGRDEIVLEVAKALERIHIHAGDHARLAKDLERQAELELDGRSREQLLLRLAELYEHKLDDLPGAIATQQKRLELDASDTDALSALERLYERSQQWQPLVGVLVQRAQLVQNNVERRELLRRAAVVHEEKRGDVDAAIEAYNEVITAFGNDLDTLAALARLYESAGRNEDLLATLEASESIMEPSVQRANLRFRMAELLREKLGQVERAISSYEAALEDDAQHAQTLAALEAIMRDESSPYRRDAGRVAAPRYEALGSYDRLLSVLELMAQTDDELEQLAALRRASEVAEHGQNDAVAAMTYLGRAVRAGRTHDSLPQLLTEYGRLADATARYAEYVACLQEIAPEIFDAEQKVRVYRRVAEVAREKLADIALSRASFRKVLEEQVDDLPALDALIALDEEVGDHAALIDVLKRKTELALSPAERAKLLSRQADVYERGLDDADKAIAALEDLVSDAPDKAAYDSLQRLYQRTHRWADLSALYEQQLERHVGDAVDLRYQLARNCRTHLSDTQAALEHLREAITYNPNHFDSIALLESIMNEHGEYRTTAAEILEPGYLARMEWAKLTAALRARVDGELDLEERKRLLLRLGRIYEEQLEDFEETMEVYARLFREDPRDEEQWETLTRLAKVGGQWNRLAKILGEALPEAANDEITAKLARYVGSLYDERIVNAVKAAEFYSKALEFDSQDAVAFTALEAAYQRSTSHAALIELYKRQAEAAPSDGQRVALLHKSARLYAGELSDRKAAIATYREILEVEPANADAISGIEGLLSETEDHAGLADHLRRRLEHAGGINDEVALKFRLGEVLSTRLGDDSGAIEAFEEALHIDPSCTPAMSALEQLVQNEAHTLRVTEILEPVYRHLDQWKKLIAIYEARLALVSDPVEAVRLLSEVAQLHEQRGADLRLAFHAYQRAFAREPDNDAIRAHIDRLAARRESWDDHVAAYEAALVATQDDAIKAQLLTTIARVHDEKRGDPRSAIQAYERLLAVESEDPSTLDALESLLTMVGDWRGLVAVFERKVKAAFSSEERSDVLRRMGSVLDDLLADRDAAIAAYRRALAEVETDELALDALDRLYEAGGQAAELAPILGRRIELAQDPAARAELGVRLGHLLEEQLHQFDAAIDAYRRVLDDEPQNPSAIARLAALYERQGLWQELLDNLAAQASLAASTEERVRLRCKAGQVLQRELLDVPEAIELYRQALEDDPRCNEAVQALMALTANEEHRARAAEVVEPLLREQERWDDLVQLIERRVESILDPAERAAEVVRLAEIHEHGRKQPGDAFSALTRALAHEPADAHVQDELERLAAALDAWQRLASVFSERASGMSDPSESAALYRRAGRVARDQIRDAAQAIDAYVRASERDDDAPETLLALDELYAKTQRTTELVEVLDRRIAALTAPSERAELLNRLGELRDVHLGDGRGAFVAYQEVLDNDVTDARALAGMERLGQRDDLARDVLDVLDRCYREAGALEKVVGLYDIKIRLAPMDREKVLLLRDAAALWEHDLGEPRRALACLRRAYELDCRDTALLDELERLATASGAWSDLSGLCEGLLASSALEGTNKRDVALRCAGWYREHTADVTGEERCLRAALSVAPSALDVHQRVTVIVRGRDDRPALVRALRALADAEADAAQRREHLMEAGRLSVEIAAVDGAAECFDAVLAADAQDAAALAALAELRAGQGRVADMVVLLMRLVPVESEPQQRTQLRYRVAQAQAEQLRDSQGALATYRALLDQAPDEEPARSALEALLESLGRWDELRGRLQERLERSADAQARVAVRSKLARLAEQELQQPELAVEQWAQIVAQQPDHAEANVGLERLYRAGGLHAELASFLRERAQRAVQAGELALAVDRLWALSRVCEEALHDSEQAVAALARIHELAPQERNAVEGLIRLHSAAGRFAQAAQLMQVLMALQPADEAVQTAYALAELAGTQLSDPALVEQALRRALELDPSRTQSRELLKLHYEKHGELDKLAQLLAQEAEAAIAPADQVVLWNRIAALYADKLKDPGRAVVYLERAAALVPDDRTTLLALCDLYIAAQRQADAIPVLGKIIASYGGRRAKEVAVYEHRLGQAYEGGGQLDEALKHYDAAFKIDLTSVPVLRDLGRLCWANGDLDRAQKTYRALLLQKLGADVGIQKADVYFHLGEISAKQGDKPKAKAMLERAISEAGQHPAAKALIEQL
ncbi:MAG TPA: tetratricopeptide repeat protein [Polyangiales bacterium]